MAKNIGKEFEEKLKEDWKRTVPHGDINRIYDTVNGLRGVSNLCDFIGFKKPNIFYLEAKTHKGNTFPFTNLSQYDKLVTKIGIDGVRTGVIIWFYSHDRIVYIPIASIKKMKEDGKKSVNITTLDNEGYKFINIPSVKKRVYFDSDYSVLLNLEEGD